MNQQAYQRQQSELAKALGSLGISPQLAALGPDVLGRIIPSQIAARTQQERQARESDFLKNLASGGIGQKVQPIKTDEVQEKPQPTEILDPLQKAKARVDQLADPKWDEYAAIQGPQAQNKLRTERQDAAAAYAKERDLSVKGQRLELEKEKYYGPKIEALDDEITKTKNIIGENQKLLDLVENNDLQSDAFYGTLGALGIPEKVWKRPARQLADSISSRLFTEVVGNWKGRGAISNAEGQQIKREIADPSIQTAEGLKYVATMSILNNAEKALRIQAKRDIMIANGGRAPIDISKQIDEAIYPRPSNLKQRCLN